MTIRRACALAVAGSLAVAGPAAAHGIGGRGDLPIPKEYFIWAAAAAVAVSFAWSLAAWKRPVLAAHAERHQLPEWTSRATHWLEPILRVVSLQFAALVGLSAWFGVEDPASNLAPVAVYVVLWVGVLWLSALAGDVWRSMNPWDSVAACVSGFGPTPDPHPPTRALVWSHWPAALGLAAFVWLELAYYEPSSPRVLAIAITAYSVVVLGMAARFGRRWLQTGEAFTVLFGLVAAIAPIARRADGRLGFRAPFSGLATLPVRRGTAAAVVVVIGGTTFDGVSRTPWWGEIIRLHAGWDRTAINTLGLAGTILAAGTAYVLACALVARLGGGGVRHEIAGYAPSLVPIALAYSVAHYFSLLVFEGQSAYRLVSDPLGRGWNLFGTAEHRIDYLALTTTTIALVVTIAMVVGHVAGIVLSHERGLGGAPRHRNLAQVPMATVMVAFTVVGLTLLLSV